MADAENRWLLCIHQIPPKPNYFRVKTWRRLQRLGAVAIKNSVYVLPKGEQAYEDFQWLRREIVKDGGDASICEARFVHGLSDEEIETIFRSARTTEYGQVAEAGRRLLAACAGADGYAERLPPAADVAKLRRRLAEIVAIDFFGASGRETAEGLLTGLEGRLRRGSAAPPTGGPACRIDAYRRRTWVTRKGVHIDRIACAWLIRHFIDRHARFKFVPARGYRPRPGEQRFDMFEAEFTHEGDRCTFEVLTKRFGLNDPALRPIAEIVHDIDLKDARFGRPEIVGVERLIAGIAMAHKDDSARLERGAALFDDLYAYFKRKRG